MKTRNEIFEEILKDQSVTDAVLAISASFKGLEDTAIAFPHYYRVAAALSDVVNKLELTSKHAPQGAVGAAAMVPFVTIALPGFHDPFTAHWGDEYLKSQGIEEIFFEEEGLKARELGDAGDPNYLHGLLVISLVGDYLIQVAGTSLMMAAAMNIKQGLEETGSFKA